jgi:4-alpha-glucanotransferase
MSCKRIHWLNTYSLNYREKVALVHCSAVYSGVFTMGREAPTGLPPASGEMLPLTPRARAELAASVLPVSPQAGVCLHITSLPGAYGIGEIGAGARRFLDTLAVTGLHVWQFLPLGPTAYGDSPYQPLSTFAGNEMLIDVGELVSMGLLSAHETAPLQRLPLHSVDYGRLIPLKTALLQHAAERFSRVADAGLRAEFDRFVDEHDRQWLHDYALFRILKSGHGERPWMDWEADYVHRETRALAQVARQSAHAISGIKVLQFLFDRQWRQLRAHARERGITLFGDMPICIAFDSADAWVNRDILRVDADGQPDFVAGVPPDYFSENGQLWGNPLYDWEKHRANGYAWWIKRLRASATLADIVRIDHFRGFEAYWAVPAGAANARVGSWQPGPGDSLFEAFRSALGTLPIVAEDLGVITEEVEALRKRHAIPGMHVLQFDVDVTDFALTDVDANAVCYTGTHDNDTTLGWFRGSPDDRRSPAEIAATQKAALALTGGSPETIHLNLIRAAFATAARMAIAPMQDFLGLGSEARINTPGTSTGNWRWRMLDTQLDAPAQELIGNLVAAAGRNTAEA